MMAALLPAKEPPASASALSFSFWSNLQLSAFSYQLSAVSKQYERFFLFGALEYLFAGS
jgi:hypothetical protein